MPGQCAPARSNGILPITGANDSVGRSGDADSAIKEPLRRGTALVRSQLAAERPRCIASDFESFPPEKRTPAGIQN